MTQHVLTVRQTENKESECSIKVHASLHAHARLRAINRPNLLNKQVICQSVNTEILKRPNRGTTKTALYKSTYLYMGQMTQQQCPSNEGQWLVHKVKGQSHQAQLTKR